MSPEAEDFHRPDVFQDLIHHAMLDAEDHPPRYQVNFLRHRLIGVFNPFLMDSRKPGMDTR